MLVRLAELLQCDPEKVAELSCMSGICDESNDIGQSLSMQK